MQILPRHNHGLNPTITSAAQNGSPQTSCPLASRLISPGVSEKDQKALLGHLGKLPKPALEKLVNEGWTVSPQDVQTNADGTKDAGGCNPHEKSVRIDSEVLHSDKGGRVLLHEMAHALDFKGSTPPKGMLGRMLSKAGMNGGRQMQFHSNQDAKMAQVYQGFQARNLAEFGAKVLNQAQAQPTEAPQAFAFKTDFHGSGQVLTHGGNVIVSSDNKSAACQKKSGMFEVQSFGLPEKSQHNVQGATLGYQDTEGAKTVIFSEQDSSKLQTTWTENGNYVASSNLPAELYAEAVAAYLDTPDSRQALAQEAPELHALVQESMNEYLIAK